jgi:hypothetical protein
MEAAMLRAWNDLRLVAVELAVAGTCGIFATL